MHKNSVLQKNPQGIDTLEVRIQKPELRPWNSGAGSQQEESSGKRFSI
jgi:hypothetical protein